MELQHLQLKQGTFFPFSIKDKAQLCHKTKTLPVGGTL